MSDERTITVKATSIESRRPLWTAVNEAASIGEDLEITIRRLPQTKRRQWIFTETGETRRAKVGEWILLRSNEPSMVRCSIITEEFPILRAEEREVDA